MPNGRIAWASFSQPSRASSDKKSSLPRRRFRLIGWWCKKIRTRENARAWLQSEERRQLLNEVKSYFIGNDDIHLLCENETQRQKTAVSVVISCKVSPGREQAFLEWQRR
jgi:hypothetical protein